MIMTRGIVVFIILSFAGLAVFGFLGMGSHEMEHNVNGCLAALGRETGCPAPTNSLEFAVFHLSAFKIFSSADIGAMALLSAMFAALALFLAYLLKIFEPKPSVIQAKTSKFREYPRSYEFYIPNKLKFIRWLALREMRGVAAFSFGFLVNA